tara:strand:- start:448 stop:864 length:417 start_codon:yes stop_codon:yes gene_type:complete
MAYEDKSKATSDEDKELPKEEPTSLDRQRARRELNKRKKELRKQEKEGLSNASGTKERRGIKKAADDALERAEANFNETYYPSRNKQDYESDIGERGIDQFTAPEATSQSGSSNSFTLDIVKDDNTAGTATFNGPGIN